jgi:hypothetical protein
MTVQVWRDFALSEQRDDPPEQGIACLGQPSRNDANFSSMIPKTCQVSKTWRVYGD